MKKIFLIASAIAALAAAAPAQAADLDLNLGITAVVQDQNGNVTQASASAAAAVGSTGNNVDITSTAVNAAQLATIDMSVVQGGSGLVNGNGHGTGVLQTLDGAVNQTALSLAGSGNLGAGSAINSTAASLGQSATVNVRVRQ